MSFSSWSTTPDSNTSVGGVNIAEGCAAGNTNNAIRSMMALLRQAFTPFLPDFFNGTVPLPIANGGTAAGNAAAARSNLGALADTYRDMPLYVKGGSFTFAQDERAGAIVFNGSSDAVGTINPNSVTPINLGAVYSVHNAGGGTLTISPAEGVSLFVNGAIASTSASLAGGASAVLFHLYPDAWKISGVGVS